MREPAGPAGLAANPAQIVFDRHELRAIFDLYGRMVAEGEWRDYAMDFLKDRAVFSVFRRRTSFRSTDREEPQARAPRRLRRHRGDGLVLKRGHELARACVLDSL